MVKGPTVSNALLILYPGFNTLDANGPYETFRQTKYGADQKNMFQVTVAALDPVTVSAEGVRMERDIALDQTLIEQLGKYDLLVVPGGTVDAVNATIKKNDPLFFGVIKTYAHLRQRSDSLPNVLLSICTGALLLATQGVFNGGIYCTTHWAAYNELALINIEAAEFASSSASSSSPPPSSTSTPEIPTTKSPTVQAGIVLPARFVDAGLNPNRVRIISSGGISCGIDASLHVVRDRAELLAGVGQGVVVARTTAAILDYAYRQTEGVTFGVDFPS